jgi:alpha-L-fucosidase
MGALFGGILCAFAANAADAPAKYEPTWDSLKQYTVPDWYQDAKFGIFIHWGVYSVPAFGNEWYPRNMYRVGTAEFKHHAETYGPQSKFGYKDFIPLFKADKFDPAAWAELFRKAGAKYIVPVAEHHDGFAMYDCSLSDYNAVKMGPKRDIIGDLAQAVRKEGLVFGLSSHRAEHWWFFGDGRKFDSDVKTDQWNGLYGPARTEQDIPDAAFLDNWLARTNELVDKYQPQVVWFDWWIEQPCFVPYLQQMAAHYYNRGLEWNKGVAINYKNKTFPTPSAVLDIERGKLDKTSDQFWQTDTSISIKSWGYIENDKFRSVTSLLHELIDIVSKNGCLLLNLGPRSDGTIPQEAQDILLGMGDWLNMNGEAIYGTRPWFVAAEGPTAVQSGSFSDDREDPFTARDIRFTRKDSTLYAICMGWPKQGEAFRVASLGTKSAAGLKVTDVTMVGCREALPWKQEADALVVNTPAAKPCDHAYVLKLTVTGTAFGDMEASLGADNTLVAVLPVGNCAGDTWKGALKLFVDGKVVDTKEASVAVGEKTKVSLSAKLNTPGMHEITVGNDDWKSAPVKLIAPHIALEGEWLFQRGDDLAWREADLKDGGWEKVTLPAGWNETSGYKDEPAYAWYRKHITIPAEWKGHDLMLPLGKIDDVDRSFFNGKSIGGKGMLPENFKTAYQEERHYKVDANKVNYGADNVIAIRVYNNNGNGGLYAGPLGPVGIK